MGIYRTIQGDTWDMIAKKVCGSDRRLDILMTANQHLLDYLIFPAGVDITIPINIPNETEELPAWRK